MRKDVSGLLDTLYESVAGIVASGGDTTELLTKSFGEYSDALDEQLLMEYGPDPEPLARGLNHVSAFANALTKMDASIEAIKAGTPIFEDDNEPVVASTAEALDRFMSHGAILLKQLVNATAEVPSSDEDAERAERAGELVKIENQFGEALLVKSELPEGLAGYLTDPVDLMTEIASLGASMVEDARTIAGAMLEADPDAIPEELAKLFPLVFEPLEKAPPFPPKRRAKTERNGADDPDEADEADDEDPDAADGFGQGAPGGPPMGGDAPDSPQNPIETITRLASIIVVIAGSLSQSMPGQDAAPDLAGGQGSDPRNVGLQRGEPILDQPLHKILAGEDAEIKIPGMGQMTFAEAIEELAELRKSVPVLSKQLNEKGDAFNLLKQRYEEIAAQPVRSPGMQKSVSVTKAEDSFPGGATTENDNEKLEKLQSSDPEGGAAAKFLIGRVHQGGGVPLVP